jgi:aminoglycoside phosphotransferase (APT) family kinase protein
VTGADASAQTPGPDLAGLDAAKVSTWLETHVDGLRGPFTYSLIAGGHSNLTFGAVDADGRRLVVRRPPLGHVLATAHDMGREHRIISALADTGVPVAPALAFCDDVEVNGAPFYVMAYVDGFVVRTPEDAEAVLSPAARHRAGLQLADVLSGIHAVDVDAVGLGDLGRKDGYVERQLKRWYRQWNQSKTRELADVDRAHDALLAHVPEQQGVAVVHGDYRLDNCMVDAEGSILAVLDWEICTLGDPLADVGLLAVYCGLEAGGPAGLATSPTSVAGFPSVDEVLARYAEASGRDLSGIDFYVAFGHWKLACILEGVYARYLAGAMGQRDPAGFDGFRVQVERAAAQAAEIAGRLR